MALKFRKKVLLFGVESVYGTDPTLTEAANAVMASNVTIQPLVADMIVRGNIRPTLGGETQLHIGKRVTLDFMVEMAGSGIAGMAPAYAPILRAAAWSGMSHALITNHIATAGSASSITLAVGESAVDDFYNNMYISIISGTGSGQSKKITDYVGSTRVASASFSPAVDNTSHYTIYDYVTYSLISTGEESATAYFWQDGIKQVITGIRGSIRFLCDPKGIPHLQFTGTGIYAGPSAVANPTPVLTAYVTPVEVSDANSDFSLHSYAAPMLALTVDQANAAAYVNIVGGAGVEISDRAPGGQVTIREPATGTKDYFAAIDSETLGAFSFIHGTVVGNTCTLAGPSVQLLSPTRGNDAGFATLQMNLSFIPTSAGDDELTFTVA